MKIFRRILIELVIILLGYEIGLTILARVPLVELLIAPSGGSDLAVAIAAIALLLRFFVLICLPGYVLARWYLLATAEPPSETLHPISPDTPPCTPV